MDPLAELIKRLPNALHWEPSGTDNRRLTALNVEQLVLPAIACALHEIAEALEGIRKEIAKRGSD